MHAELKPAMAIRAIHELNRMDGHHAPVRAQLESTSFNFQQQIPEQVGTTIAGEIDE